MKDFKKIEECKNSTYSVEIKYQESDHDFTCPILYAKGFKTKPIFLFYF